MPYSQFKTITSVKEVFNLSTEEGRRFFPELDPIFPSLTLQDYLSETLPMAIATGSEKARSELLITPVLVEVRRFLNRQISVFSGEDFTVDESLGLSGRCDFLLTRSREMLGIEAPAIIIVEAKQADLKTGLGQCIAEMVAVQRFNEAKQKVVTVIYGCVSNGIQWQFLKLEKQLVTVDLTVYPLPPVEQILAFFVWMIREG
jgi:hypothetical protein